MTIKTMPDKRYYTVIQEREVKVVANSAIDAALIADDAFECRPNDDSTKIKLYDVWGNATTDVRTRDLIVREDY